MYPDYDEYDDYPDSDYFGYDEERSSKRDSRYDCSDRMCGALDCGRCHPELIGVDLDAEEEDEDEEDENP